jgi:polyhydroxyalkanoate synthase
MHTQMAWLCHPAQLAESNARLAQKLSICSTMPPDVAWGGRAGSRAATSRMPHVLSEKRNGRTRPARYPSKQWYLILTHHLQDMLYETPGQSARHPPDSVLEP